MVSGEYTIFSPLTRSKEHICLNNCMYLIQQKLLAIRKKGVQSSDD